MTRLLTAPLVVAALVAFPASGATITGRSKATPPQRASVGEILDRSGAAGETMALRDLIAFDQPASTDGAELFAAQRAAMRACHAERYAQARDNVLTGRALPLRSC